MENDSSAMYMCPHCGAFVSEKAEKCPNCGGQLEPPDDEEIEMELDTLIESGEEIGADAVICPRCGTEMPDGPCKKCGTEIKEDIPQVVEKAVTLFLCSECGAFTAETEKECSNCGASLEEETEDAEVRPEPEVQDAEPETTEADEILEMLITGEEEEVPDDDKILDMIKGIESPDDVVSLIDSISEEEVDEELEGLELEIPESSEDEDDEIILEIVPTDEEIESEMKKVEAIESVESKIPDEAEIKPASDQDVVGLCATCGAFVAPGLEKCGVCKAPLTEDTIIRPSAVPEPGIKEKLSKKAQETLRKILGILDSTELEPVDDMEIGGELNLCTVCGAFLADSAKKCAICGTHAEEMPEFIPPTPEEVVKDISLALCPYCGVFLSEGAKKCTMCGENIPDGATLEEISPEGADVRDDTDVAGEILLKAFRVSELKEVEIEEITDSDKGIDLCPDCGAFVSLNASACPVCGSALVEGLDTDVEDDILDLETTIEDLASIECPNCASTIDVGAPECPLCGLAFETSEIVTEVVDDITHEDESGEDISDLLEKEFPDSPIPEEKKPPEPLKKEEPALDILEVIEMLEPLETEKDTQEEPLPELEVEEPVPVSSDELADSMDPASFEGLTESKESASYDELDAIASSGELDAIASSDELDVAEQPPEPESLVWEEDAITEISKVEVVEPVKPKIEAKPKVVEREVVVPEAVVPKERDAPVFFPEPVPMRREPTNWEFGIYPTVAAVLFFIIYYTLAPGGDYPLYLAILFGIMIVVGIYFGLTEKGTFMKGDLGRAGVFITGCFIVAFIALHWLGGFLTDDYGIMAQPGLDRLLLSLGILLIGVGIIWIRARVRYVLIWLGGIIFLFLSSVAHTQLEVFDNVGANSSILLVGAIGAVLVFMSLGFLAYEKRIKTSIETDIVMGDVEYTKRDFNKALASYDSAMDKVRDRQRQSVVGPPMHYDVPWYSKGSALILMGELGEGIKCLDMALAINPNNEVTWVNKGNAHSRLGQHKYALRCYNRAIQLNPSYDIAWNNKGNFLARQKKYLEALKCYNTAIKINPDYDDVWINKGYVLVKMGKQKEAMKCINQVKLRPRYLSGPKQPVQTV